MSIIGDAEPVDDFCPFGIRAFTTSRSSGSFGLMTGEAVRDVTARWSMLRRDLGDGGGRIATATQVHGSRVLIHNTGWEGWLRGDEADGHVTIDRGTTMAVTIADCVPVFLAHPSGASAVLHSGWRGTAADITTRAIEVLRHRGVPTAELRLHLGPAICGRCYEVAGDVYEQLTGRRPARATTIDLRAIIVDRARFAGVRHISVSPSCTRCNNERFFSHRAGDEGRQLGVIIAEA